MNGKSIINCFSYLTQAVWQRQRFNTWQKLQFGDTWIFLYSLFIPSTTIAYIYMDRVRGSSHYAVVCMCVCVCDSSALELWEWPSRDRALFLSLFSWNLFRSVLLFISYNHSLCTYTHHFFDTIHFKKRQLLLTFICTVYVIYIEDL